MEQHKQLQPEKTDAADKQLDQGLIADIERMAAVGKLVTKIAHELNSPIDGILRYINLSIRAIDSGNLKKPKYYLQRCRQALMRMVEITSELLEFARSSYPPAQERINVTQIADDAVKIMESRAQNQNVTIARNYHPNLPAVNGTNLFGVFCNLIKNALDAMPNGGRLAISTKLQNDSSIAIEFRDTGCGFDTNDAKAIFEPFYTTKEKGTGLGLAICKDIIQKHNGTITAENAPEKGSIFTVYLPVEKT